MNLIVYISKVETTSVSFIIDSCVSFVCCGIAFVTSGWHSHKFVIISNCTPVRYGGICHIIQNGWLYDDFASNCFTPFSGKNIILSIKIIE